MAPGTPIFGGALAVLMPSPIPLPREPGIDAAVEKTPEGMEDAAAIAGLPTLPDITPLVAMERELPIGIEAPYGPRWGLEKLVAGFGTPMGRLACATAEDEMPEAVAAANGELLGCVWPVKPPVGCCCC